VFHLKQREKPSEEAASRIHLLGPGIICDTEARGYATPAGRSITEIVVDASEGFIPLWAPDVSLRWRFRESSMTNFSNPAAAKAQIRNLLGEALVAWDGAAPVAFTEDVDVWDFEVVMRTGDNCTPSGCVLASSFFPDSGRHQLTLYPKMLTQSRKEQVDTLIHEIGHVFGLRHFFAQVSETAWPSEIFGTHSKFSIMNYGELSELTADDKNDLRRLYQSVWAGSLTSINGTPIRLLKPYHTLAAAPEGVFAIGRIPPALHPSFVRQRPFLEWDPPAQRKQLSTKRQPKST
jgi:hypothetical protein